MRVGEVLGMKKGDIDFNASTISITSPKSGRLGEKVYITKKLSSRLHLLVEHRDSSKPIFNVSYSTIHRMIRDAGLMLKVKLSPHDLRRHAATQASRNNIPLEIVSKVILRHADIAATQGYLGEVDPREASRWVEHLNR